MLELLFSQVFFILVILFMILGLAVWLGRKGTVQRPRRWIRMESGEQWETDLRLPYKKFKELYPESRITYMEYKQLQMQRAFKRATGSERNKRMVR